MSFLKIGSLGSSSSSRTHSAANSDSESELDEAAKRGRRDKRRSITSFLLGKGYSKGKSASPPSRIQRKRRPSGEEGRSRSPSADRGVPIDDSEADLTDKEGVKEGVRSSVVPDNAFTDDEEEDSDDQGQGGQLDQSSSSEEEDEWAPVNAKAVAQVQAKMSDPQVQSKMKEPTPAPPAAAPVDDDDDDGWDPVPSAKVADTPAQDGVKSVATPAEVKKAKEDGYEEIDMAKELQLYRNTEANTGDQTVFSANRIYEADIYNDGLMLPQEDDHPNLVQMSEVSSPTEGSANSTKKSKGHLQLQQSPASYEMNRCTIIIEHGDPTAAAEKSRRVRSFLVASDLSDEARYAVEWAIGTVLRDGDSAIFVTVIETDTKLDTPDMYPQGATKSASTKNQQDRLERVEVLAKQAASLLVRTRLNLNITCQAIHAKNARHMIVDMIDFVEPTMVIVGSRGTGKIKGMLLGSVSHYLVQKSSVPVMVARRRLRRTGPKRKPVANLDRHARVPLGHAETEKESHAGNILHEKDMLIRDEEEDDELGRKDSIGVIDGEMSRQTSTAGSDSAEEGSGLKRTLSDLKDGLTDLKEKIAG